MNATKRSYESMFLLASEKTDFEAASEPIRNVLARNEAEVLLLKAWDERRLTYGIRGHKRGLYALAFFQVDPSRVVEIEHDCRLDERFLRVLIIRRDRLTAEEIEAERNRTTRPPGGFDPDARAAEAEERAGRGFAPGGYRREGRNPNEAKDERNLPAEAGEETAQA
jgi:small subunit ribosomal protein S6